MYSHILTPFPVHKSLYCAICLCSLWSNVFICLFGGQVIQNFSISTPHTPDLARMGKMGPYKSCTLIPFFISLIFDQMKHIYGHARVYLNSEHATMTPTQTITHAVPCDPVSLRFLTVKTGLVITGGSFCKAPRSRSCSPIETRPRWDYMKALRMSGRGCWWRHYVMALWMCFLEKQLWS